ncbi:MAG: LysM peptidoglycan-binding domain-containing protein [Oscillospiraceae bacterium]|nr:LysM peptidoglycan-binding domain-containing protein [Oscillospiraceae bacterium]
MNGSPLNDEELQDVSGGTQIPYIVAPGDTIEEIAKRFRCTVEQICRWNNIRNPQDIRVGQKLIIRF